MQNLFWFRFGTFVAIRTLCLVLLIGLFAGCDEDRKGQTVLSQETDPIQNLSPTRIVVGTLDQLISSKTLSALSTSSLLHQEQTCQVQKVVAIESDGAKIEAELNGECEFELALQKGHSYALTFLNDKGFFANLVFNNLTRNFLPMGYADTRIDLGPLAIIDLAVVSNHEDEILCQIDGDEDGIPLCEDPDEMDKKIVMKTEDDNIEDLENLEDCDPLHQVLMCHYPAGNVANAQTICVDQNSVKFAGHLNHGDTVGSCYGEDDDDKDDDLEEIHDDDLVLDDGVVADIAFCDHGISVYFDFLRTQNWDDGDLRPFTYVGLDPNPYWPWDSIELIDDNGNVIVDEAVDLDVPGIALRRGAGWIDFYLPGNHKGRSGKEALNGVFRFEGASIVKIENDNDGRFERQNDEYAIFGQSNQDEFTVLDEYAIQVIATVTVNQDGFRVYYQSEGCD